MASYFTLLTNVGAAKLANAIALQQDFTISQMAIGDGGGSLPVPSTSRTALVNEVRRGPVNRVEKDPDNPAWVVVEQVLPPEIGGWTIREVGLYDAEGDLVAYGNYPETYKPVLAEGSARTQTIRFIAEVGSAEAVTLKVDPSIVLATREWAEQQAAAKVLAHDQDPAAHMGNHPLGMGLFTGRMRAGQAVKIAFFGDSTTDGNSSSGWTPNPVDGNQMAIGATDHGAAGGYNAYPRRLQDMLRLFYGNNLIRCYNAGYSGKRLDNGWALNNLDAAVLRHPIYKDCDAVVVVFGLNDAAQNGSRLEAFVSESKKVIEAILKAGKLPILMASDAHWRSHDDFDNTGNNYENTEIVELNDAKRALCAQYGIPHLEMHDRQRDWMNRNGGYTWWRKVAPDGMHSNDEGHQIKACIVAAQFIPEIYRVGRHVLERINWQDSRARFPYDHSPNFSPIVDSASMQNNFQVPPGRFVHGANLVDAWVWCEEGDLPLIYRAISDAGQAQADLTIDQVGRIKVYHMGAVDPSAPIYDKEVNGAGARAIINHTFDRPCRLLRLPYGLCRITMTAPAKDLTRNLFGGHFEINPSYKMAERKPFFLGDLATLAVLKSPTWQQNLIERSGPQKFVINAPAAGRYVFSSREERDGSNTVDFGVPGQKREIYLRAKLSQSTGVMMFSGPSYRENGEIITNEGAFFVYRPGSTAAVRLYVYGDEGSLAMLGEGVLSTNYVNDLLECVIVFERNAAGDQLVSFYEGSKAVGTPLITSTSATTGAAGPWAGTMGGAFANLGPSSLNTDLSVEILEMVARHYG
ncbi:phage tail protein [Pseudomonas sp. BJa5]|uniref:phage tail-collar fiber domain-containing protein n=1 Tax=Pseudomonas sp. BJa5 TaxID=2936270 RepID=UPI002559933F|nr:phage tail protein [Pseudomonas sp. BGr12]MDL2419619.1 phage tail protein [Pseudomonas sp. BGr12]